jgi:hypothetical protein
MEERPFDLAEFGAFLHVLPAFSPYLSTPYDRLVQQCEEARELWPLVMATDLQANAEVRGRTLVACLLDSCNTPLRCVSCVLELAPIKLMTSE